MCNCGRSSRKNTNGGRSSYSRANSHAPAQAPRMVVVTPTPRRSIFRDAAAVAGGVTVGTTMGHLAGEAISSLFRGPRGHEVMSTLPQNYNPNQPPDGPCAYEIGSFLNCAANNDELQACEQFRDALNECKRRNRIP